MEVTSDREKLKNLLVEAWSGSVVLRQLQRNVVESHDGIEDLIRSVIEGYSWAASKEARLLRFGPALGAL